MWICYRADLESQLRGLELYLFDYLLILAIFENILSLYKTMILLASYILFTMAVFRT